MSDPEIPPGDEAEQSVPTAGPGARPGWDAVGRERGFRAVEVPEADALDQLRPVDPEGGPVAPHDVPLDAEVPEADAVEQAMAVNGDDDDHPHGPDPDDHDGGGR